MKKLVPAVLLAVWGISAALTVPARNGMTFPGFDSVSLAFGGFRSVGFGDPMCLLTNPSGISMRQGISLFSISAGPVISDISFGDGTGTHSDSWVKGLGVYSFGMKVQVIDGLVVGVAGARTAELPLRTLYYIPESFSGGVSSSGSVELEGEFSEVVAGLSWDAADWLSIGAAVGGNSTSQIFDINYTESSGFITHLNYQESDLSLKGGVTLPFEPVTFGLAWSSGGSFSESQLSMGGTIDFMTDIKMGAELEVASLDERTIYTGRVFGRVKPSSSIVLRGGLYFASATEAISRQGLGFSAGAGYEIGQFTVNGAFSWSPLKGDSDYYGYNGLESFSGTSPVVSLGFAWGGNAVDTVTVP